MWVHVRESGSGLEWDVAFSNDWSQEVRLPPHWHFDPGQGEMSRHPGVQERKPDEQDILRTGGEEINEQSIVLGIECMPGAGEKHGPCMTTFHAHKYLSVQPRTPKGRKSKENTVTCPRWAPLLSHCCISGTVMWHSCKVRMIMTDRPSENLKRDGRWIGYQIKGCHQRKKHTEEAVTQHSESWTLLAFGFKVGLGQRDHPERNCQNPSGELQTYHLQEGTKVQRRKS